MDKCKNAKFHCIALPSGNMIPNWGTFGHVTKVTKSLLMNPAQEFISNKYDKTMTHKSKCEIK